MEMLTYVNYCIAVLLFACYLYQFIYVPVALFIKPKRMEEAEAKRYAVVISARNEEAVITQLIGSIQGQNYPKGLVDIFVVADNCTDRTAQAAKDAGAIVYERFNITRVGKGYALCYLFDKIREDYPAAPYEGYLILDADNLLDENYMREMNKTFSRGYRIVTSYRNSKNYGDNWISAGYSLWFLREARYLNQARMTLGTSCAVSGTGFLVHRELIRRNGGWKHFLLTEDIEFTIESVLQGERIGYCATAVLYDEQPVTFTQSWRQRLRWAKGYIQVFGKYGLRLVAGIFTRGGFSCFDMTMAILPAIVFTVASVAINLTSAAIDVLHGAGEMAILFQSVWETLSNAYLVLLGLGAITVLTEWKHIHCPAHKKILYCFTFPLFMFTYIPISVTALFCKVDWKPIHHTVSKSLEEVRAPLPR